MTKDIRVVRMLLTNFKGIRSLEVNFDPEVTNIFGDNATGKSTMMDAFLWTLFGKDSQNRADFNIKTLDANGKALPKLEHEVVVVISVDGVETVFRRCYKENWVKKRGTAKEVMDGHSVDYFVDDVPYGKREYDAKVSAICPEQLFRQITNPAYFPSLKMQEQRRMLFEIVGGDITHHDVFNELITDKNKEYFRSLVDALDSGKTLDEYKKQIVSQKNKTKGEVADIPGRIEENNRNMPEEEDWVALSSDIDEKENEIKNIDSLIADRSKADEEEADRRRGVRQQIDDKYERMEEVKRQVKKVANTEHDKWYSDLSAKESEISNLKTDIRSLEDRLPTLNNSLEEYNSQRGILLQEYKAINSETFEVDNSALVCPTCKRVFEGEDYASKLSEMQDAFQTNKSNRLKANVQKGTTIKAKIEDLQKQIQTVEQTIGEKKNLLSTLESEKQQLHNSEPKTVDVIEALERNEKYIALKKEVETLEASLKTDYAPADVSEHINAKKALQSDIYALKERLSKREQIERTQKRINELQSQLTNMQQQIADYEQIEASILDFMKSKVSLVEKRINSAFSYVQFRMFDTQVDGTEFDTCECMVEGTPYSDLNTAAKMNAGIDIINAICRAKGVTAPIWLDNRESVCNLIPCRSQIINLFVERGAKLTIQ
jgi:hypothetical protein